MEKGIDRIKIIIEEECGSNINLRNFFFEFIEKELYTGHYTDELKSLIDKYSSDKADKDET
ncbi:MAG: hypothetical protein QHH04_09420 [Methanolinea sp.]|jgi:hypothetical protein|nr:hypothetical protein [Methanolinea sp.]